MRVKPDKTKGGEVIFKVSIVNYLGSNAAFRRILTNMPLSFTHIIMLTLVSSSLVFSACACFRSLSISSILATFEVLALHKKSVI